MKTNHEFILQDEDMDSEDEDVHIVSGILGVTKGSEDEDIYVPDEAPKGFLGL